MAEAEERIHGLEDEVATLQEQLDQEQERSAGQVATLQEQLDQERMRNSELVNELKAAQARRALWWRFW